MPREPSAAGCRSTTHHRRRLHDATRRQAQAEGGSGSTGTSSTSTVLLERQASNAAASSSSLPASGTGAPVTATPAVTPPLPRGPAPITTSYLQLLAVPVLWGTYPPAIRYLYQEDDPLDAASLTAVRTTISFLALLLAALVGEGVGAVKRRRQGGAADPLDQALELEGDGVAAAGAAAVTAAPSAAAAAPGPVNSQRLGPLLTRTFDSVVFAGLELGLLNFLGTALQVSGLQTTSATRAGFLVQLTSVVTPLVAYAAGYDIPPLVLLAVALGMGGSSLVALDSIQMRSAAALADGSALPAAALSTGELQVLLSCVFFSMGTVRMGLYAPRMKAINLTTWKKLGLSAGSMIWLAWNDAQRGHAPANLLSLFPDLSGRSATSLAVLFYSSVGPGSLASFLQASGQTTVPATQAQVLFSLTPIFSAIFASLLLGGENMGPLAWAGGGLITVAGLIAASAQQPQPQPQPEQQPGQQEPQQGQEERKKQ